MLVIGSIASDFATAVGVVAGMVAVGGFLAHSPKVLTRAPEKDVQVATVMGGARWLLARNPCSCFVCNRRYAGKMTESRAIALIVVAATVLEASLVLGMAAVGVGGPVLGLGAIVPLALAAFACSAVVGREGGSRLRR